ncbi:MAG: hypothetical protein JXB49_32325 [Bacteroidales bacterium]|nr:hypothetical protein [Bacteroidales bacterium]
MKINANEIEWHDATITEIVLSSVEDAYDRLKIHLESESFIESFGKERLTILIKDCYKIRTELNLWIKGMDTINSVTIDNESCWINEERKSGLPKPAQLKHFRIITNSNSFIEALLTFDDCFELE